MKVVMEKSVVIDGVKNTADVFGNLIKEENPTELYIQVVVKIIKAHPETLGQKETHFTTNLAKARSYTGTTRQFSMGGRTVYLKTGFSTKDKWNGIKAICKLTGVGFTLRE